VSPQSVIDTTTRTTTTPPRSNTAANGSHIWSTVKRVQLAAHLIVLAFFFLLRVGEYTRSSGKRLTVPLRNQDVKLWRGGFIIPNDSSLAVLMTADVVTICLENQKNGILGSFADRVTHHPLRRVVTIQGVGHQGSGRATSSIFQHANIHNSSPQQPDEENKLLLRGGRKPGMRDLTG
jgi:hypothetical protein